MAFFGRGPPAGCRMRTPRRLCPWPAPDCLLFSCRRRGAGAWREGGGGVSTEFDGRGGDGVGSDGLRDDTAAAAAAADAHPPAR